MKNSEENRPTRPSVSEERWVDFDEETGCFGIFGVDSGFCYGLYASEDTANDRLTPKNDVLSLS